MCLTLRCCFPCRSCRKEDIPGRPGSRTRLSSTTMPAETVTDGLRLINILPDGRWFTFGRVPRAQAGVQNPSMTDGQSSPGHETPQIATLTFEQRLEAQLFYEAGELLIEREERLFGEINEKETLTHHEEEVNKLAADHQALKELVLQNLSLSLGEVNLEALTSAVKAVNQEEDQDQRWTQRSRTPPDWRPGEWRKLHNSTLRSLVKERLENPMTPLDDQGNMSAIQADICSMGRQLKEDLLSVVDVVKGCYPPEWNISHFYASLYHQAFSARLRTIADYGLGDKDCTVLLRWVNEFYPQLLQKPELASEIDVEALGKLLPNDLLKNLEEQYLTKQQEDLTMYIKRILEDEEQKWNKGEAPTRRDGCFVSPVACDIIQVINGTVKSAEIVVGDLHKAQSITCQLRDLMQRDVLNNNKQLFTEDVRGSLSHVLTDMKQSAHSYLLKPVHDVLKPQYRMLGTNKWLDKAVFEKLLDSIENQIQDLCGSSEASHQKLIGQLHQEVAQEYVKRLLKQNVKLKDKDQQLKAYGVVKNNAESLHHLFAKMGSEKDWCTEILTKIAEVLKLQDLPAIQMQIASLGSAYPDLSEKHVSALLKLKTNLTRADRKNVKETLLDILGETGSSDSPRPFFSGVQVK
ncbi:tumor necrosis factor alpha-induced protein 2 isoform X2 [Etheostoma spectabile]|uniref:tumor necrosis factor alpha-induced protein 2 isoform X2 n=1 Tax=Etheostoma spectabile TaxID=54343 RepID=UPI0013AEA7E9|nr:tumor necrosis factor alpha-induced protein 2 isoform X2 [Etheostoma spectabile]